MRRTLHASRSRNDWISAVVACPDTLSGSCVCRNETKKVSESGQTNIYLALCLNKSCDFDIQGPELPSVQNRNLLIKIRLVMTCVCQDGEIELREAWFALCCRGHCWENSLKAVDWHP